MDSICVLSSVRLFWSSINILIGHQEHNSQSITWRLLEIKFRFTTVRFATATQEHVMQQQPASIFQSHIGPCFTTTLLVRASLHLHTCCFQIQIVFQRQSPQWARISSCTRFLDHTQRRCTVGRTPLDESSARRKDLE